MKNNGLIRLLYNHNPFYLISACLVLYGVQTTIADSSAGNNIWCLASILAGLSILMWATAFLIVRFGRVWDDARSIFMVLLLLFFSLSVSFDQLCITDPRLAVAMLGLCFTFSVFISEGVVRSLNIKFPALFRGPYYLILALSFAYPLVFAARQVWFSHMDPRWLLAAFPIVAATAIMTLMPAVRAGASYVQKNETPWNWPLYPWSVFILMFIGICGRNVLLCMSFEPASGWSSIFGTYLLVPIFLAALILLLEIATVQKNRSLQQCALLLMLLLVPLAMSWQSSKVYSEFLDELTSQIGSPLWLVSIAISTVYFVAWVRNIDRAFSWLTLSLAGSVLIAPTSNEFFEAGFASWPMFVLALIYAALGLRKRNSRLLVAASFFGALGTSFFGIQIGHAQFALVASAHVILAGIILVGILCKDSLARRLNAIAGGAIVGFGILTIAVASIGWLDTALVLIEFAILISLAMLSWTATHDRLMIYAAGATVILGAIHGTQYSVGTLGTEHHKQLAGLLLTAAVCFAVGTLISLLKGGMAKRLQAEWTQTINDIKCRFILVEKPVSIQQPPELD